MGLFNGVCDSTKCSSGLGVHMHFCNVSKISARISADVYSAGRIKETKVRPSFNHREIRWERKYIPLGTRLTDYYTSIYFMHYSVTVNVKHDINCWNMRVGVKLTHVAVQVIYS